VRKKLHVPSEIYELPIRIHRADGPNVLYTGYKEHIQTIRNRNGSSVYSNHILNVGHAYGSITDAMKVIKIKKKSIIQMH
jgi:Cys-tRNA synthase (O-phospho-L-seryl-tRNA:Cys-tRNA synthase)